MIEPFASPNPPDGGKEEIEEIARDSTAIEASVVSSTDSNISRKKKRSKGRKKRAAADVDKSLAAIATAGPRALGGGNKLSGSIVNQILKNNPALAVDTQGVERIKVEEILRKMKLGDLMTEVMTRRGNQTGMSRHRFWSTQPVARFGTYEAFTRIELVLRVSE